ncbi:MAG TPA: hypothetical protein ENG66_01330 [Thermococcus sp.]|nr:hypothetical protein [Thermococcus sp.]
MILIPAVFASLNYHINLQKSKLLIEKGEEYEIYHAAHYWGLPVGLLWTQISGAQIWHYLRKNKML